MGAMQLLASSASLRLVLPSSSIAVIRVLADAVVTKATGFLGCGVVVARPSISSLVKGSVRFFSRVGKVRVGGGGGGGGSPSGRFLGGMINQEQAQMIRFINQGGFSRYVVLESAGAPGP